MTDPSTVALRALALALAVLAAAPAGAQGGPAGPPLDEAVQALARDRGLRVVYSADLVAGLRTSCPASTRASDRPPEAVLACVLEGTGLEARRLPSGTYALYRVSTPRPPTAPPAPPAEPARPRAVTVSGYVTDAATGEALIGAAVYAPDLGRGATTNAYGFYTLPLPAGRHRLVASYVGLTPADTVLALRADARRDVALAADPAEIGEVVVESSEVRAVRAYPSVALTGEDVQALPAVAGEADLLKALQGEPGVGGGVEGTAGLHVRGGSPDQSLVLLDGIPVYNASHLFGFLSTFNAEAVKHVELFKGGFPARYGGRLSSVVDVRMREGNREGARRHARIGLLSGSVIAEGPLDAADGSYMVAGRRTYVDLLAAPVLAATGGIDGVTPTAYFYDLNAKANARVSGRDRVYVSLYAGRDRFAGEAEDSDGTEETAGGFLTWGNATGALRWTSALSDRLFAATTLTASDYGFDVGAEAVQINPSTGAEEPYGARYVSGIRDVALHTDLDWRPAAGHTVRLGGSVVRHRYTPGVFEYDPSGAASDTTLGADPVGSWEGAVYVEDEAAVGPALVNLGLRASGYAVDGRTYGALEPRVGVRLDLGGGLAARGSVARMTQYLHLLTTVGGLGLPADLWVPATGRVPPERSWQAAVGVEGAATTGLGRTRWSLDGYVKDMDGLVTYREGAGLVRADADWQGQVTTGGGRAAGLELSVAHESARTAARLAYTLAHADRQFDAVDGGARYPYRYDRRHDLGLGLRHRLSGRVDVSAQFVYQSGLPFTVPAATYFAANPGFELAYPSDIGSYGSEQTFTYGARNGARLPAAHRLDLGATWFFRRGDRPHALSFDVYNVYNRRNPLYAEVGVRPDPESGEPRRVLVGKGVLPVLPSVSYQFSF